MRIIYCFYMQIECWSPNFTAEAIKQCDADEKYPPGTTQKFLDALEKKVNYRDLQATA
jgi:hypothetical protein